MQKNLMQKGKCTHVVHVYVHVHALKIKRLLLYTNLFLVGGTADSVVSKSIQ